MLARKEIRIISRFGAVALVFLFADIIRAQIIHAPVAEPLVFSADGQEGGRTGFFTVISQTEGAQFRYETLDVTARGGIDYVPVSGVGTNSALINITVPDDGKVEPPKTLKLIVIEEGPGFARTNSAELTIFDNEIPRSLDPTYRSDFRPMQPSYGLGEVHKFVTGRVRADGKLIIAEPPGFTIINENGAVESRHLFPEWTRASSWLSVVTPEGNIILGRGSIRPGVDSPLVKFLPNGQHDEIFNPQVPAVRIHGLAVTPQGKILVGFTHTNLSEWHVVQFNSDGSSDSSFTPLTRQWSHLPGFSFPYFYQHIEVGPDGSIQVITPDTYQQQIILKNGVVLDERPFYDQMFRPKSPDQWLGDGVVMAANDFPPSTLLYTWLYRIRADGSLDESFAPEILPTQFAYLGTQRDGKVLALANGELTRINTSPEQTNYVSIINLNGGEEDPDAYVLLQRTGDTTASRTVRIQSADSIAKAGTDYVALDTLATFEPFQTGTTAKFQMLDDDLGEGDESRILKLSSPNNDVLTEMPESLVFIWDLDPTMRLQIESSKNGDLKISKNFDPPWNAFLQSSTNLGRTWTDLAMSTNSLWIVTLPSNPAAQIFRAVKADEPVSDAGGRFKGVISE